MDTDTTFSFQAAIGEICEGIIEAVAERPGDTAARRLLRHQTAAYSLMSFMPRDPLETMLVGHCVIFDALLRDGVKDTLRGQPEDIKLRARPGLHATGKMFLAHLKKFEQMRTRTPDKLFFQPPVEEPEDAAGESPPPRSEPPDVRPVAATPDPARTRRPDTTANVPATMPLNRQQRRHPTPAASVVRHAARPPAAGQPSGKPDPQGRPPGITMPADGQPTLGAPRPVAAEAGEADWPGALGTGPDVEGAPAPEVPNHPAFAGSSLAIRERAAEPA
jgi:hypothetical protein